MFFVPYLGGKVYRHFGFREPTVAGSAYLDALQLWLFPQLKESEPDNFIWQQDGAPPHWHLLEPRVYIRAGAQDLKQSEDVPRDKGFGS
ncbi:hypothetical protein TNCV_1925991 [Trichonephila clavipes]|nr:hypothetical protein TNCV_1925991 [Trichonephila clavipes]